MIFSRHNADSKERLVRSLNYLLFSFFGCLIFIWFKERPVFVPILGFLMELSFWTHPISIAFVLTASFFLVWKFRLHLKKYATLFVFAFLGSFPFWIHEILEGFTLVEFLVPGEKKLLIGARNILTLRFEYHLPFVFSLRWKTAALLDRIEIH